MGAQICVSVCESTSLKAAAAAERAAAWADMVEIRADLIRDLDLLLGACEMTPEDNH